MSKPDTQTQRSSETDTTAFLALQYPELEASALTRAIPSSTLFQNRREITIAHEGSLYRMRITRQGKLILNK